VARSLAHNNMLHWVGSQQSTKEVTCLRSGASKEKRSFNFTRRFRLPVSKRPSPHPTTLPPCCFFDPPRPCTIPIMTTCTATSAAGTPCKNHAVKGTQLCSARWRPPGNSNAVKQGFYCSTIRGEEYADLLTYIDDHERTFDPDQSGRLAALVNTAVLSVIALPAVGRSTGICFTSSGTDAVNKKERGFRLKTSLNTCWSLS